MDEVHPYEANINPLPYICNQTKPAKQTPLTRRKKKLTSTAEQQENAGRQWNQKEEKKKYGGERRRRRKATAKKKKKRMGVRYLFLNLSQGHFRPFI